MYNAQDLRCGAKLLLSIELDQRRYEMGHHPGDEYPYSTWEVSVKKPTEHFMRTRFYSIETALHNLENRIVSAVQNRITDFGQQYRTGA